MPKDTAFGTGTVWNKKSLMNILEKEHYMLIVFSYFWPFSSSVELVRKKCLKLISIRNIISTETFCVW